MGSSPQMIGRALGACEAAGMTQLDHLLAFEPLRQVLRTNPDGFKSGIEDGRKLQYSQGRDAVCSAGHRNLSDWRLSVQSVARASTERSSLKAAITTALKPIEN